ncbi:MAG: hypothetical protein Q4G13_08610 [Moraxella sp.]|nr:hypothetical protein [Moraxella sp.]
MPQNSLTTLPLIIKIGAVMIGAIFALTLTGDIKGGKLSLNLSVMIKFAFSAYLGFIGGQWLIEHFDWGHYSYVSHGFIMMMVSVFGMLLIGIAYQAIKLSTTDKSPSEIVKEVKATFKEIFK